MQYIPATKSAFNDAPRKAPVAAPLTGEEVAIEACGGVGDGNSSIGSPSLVIVEAIKIMPLHKNADAEGEDVDRDDQE